MAEALYRKYRPQVFEDVVGQEPIERTLKNAIAQDKVSHAYLFCGPRGTGKTTTARLLAKALLCQAGPTPEPDGICEDCRLIAEGVHPDVYELDAASRTGVENVREEIISRVQFAPTRGRSKIYIIDEVHMLSVAAFNALLKTLEEPPEHVVFVLCTTDPQKVPETIHSRCQRFDFRRIAPDSMVARLGAICIAEGVEFEGEALDLVAHRAEGGLRNALTSLEQIIAFENGKVTLAGAERLLGSIDSNDMAEIISFVGQRDIASCFRWTAAYVETGADLAQFVRDMSEHVRNLYVLSLVGDDVDLEVSETMRHELISELRWFGSDRLARLMGVLGDLSAELKTSSNPRLAFEIALTRMVRPDSDLTLESLAERVEALESGYSAVAHVVPGAYAHGHGDASFVPGEGAAQAAHVPQDSQSDARPAHFGGDTAATAFARTETAQDDARLAQHAAATSDWEQPAQAARQQACASSRSDQEVADAAQASGQVGYASGPEAAPAPAQHQPVQAEAPVGGGDMAMFANPATLQRIWQATLSTVKKQKQAYGVLFMNAKARFDEGSSTLQVVFPAEAAFAFNAVQKADVQEALQAALTHAAGFSVPFRYERAGQQERQAAAAGRSEARAQSAQAESRSRFQQAAGQEQAQPGSAAQPQAQPQSEPVVQPQVRPQPEQVNQPQSAYEAAPAQPASNLQSPAAQPEAIQPQQQAQKKRGLQQQVAQPQAHQDFQAQQAAAQPQPQSTAQSQQPYEAARAQSAFDQRNSAAQPPVATSNPSYDDAPPYDDMPPYDDGYYEQVPYEDLEYGGGFSRNDMASQAPDAGGASAQASQEGRWASSAPVSSPSESAQPDSSAAGDAVDVEALLQAGFGGGVVITEIGE